MPKVGRRGHHLGRDHNLLLVGDGLSVVALDDPRSPFTTRESGSVRLSRPAGVVVGV
jgi:hypothetical protein